MNLLKKNYYVVLSSSTHRLLHLCSYDTVVRSPRMEINFGEGNKKSRNNMAIKVNRWNGDNIGTNLLPYDGFSGCLL